MLPNDSFQSQLEKYDTTLALERVAKQFELDKYDNSTAWGSAGVDNGPSMGPGAVEEAVLVPQCGSSSQFRTNGMRRDICILHFYIFLMWIV